MITAKILLHSRNPDGNSLVTFELTYPLIIHAEFMTHRCFARNAASSRAIPIEKQMHNVHTYRDSIFEFWGKNQPGMQANEPIDFAEEKNCKDAWHRAGDEALYYARIMADAGAHKQIVNRVMTPFLHITVIATATHAGLANFFNQRCHPDAQPEFQTLAFRMLHAFMESTSPQLLDWDNWHIPMGQGPDDLFGRDVITNLKIATGRLARVSYNNHNGQRIEGDDIALHDRLKMSKHWSPFEHCAKACENRLKGELTGCFGPRWLQYRKTFIDENITTMDAGTLMARKPAWLTL
jgi:thymidylate synthase ThyX